MGVGLPGRTRQGAAGRSGPERGRVLDGLRGLCQPVQPPRPGAHRTGRLDERAGLPTNATSSLDSLYTSKCPLSDKVREVEVSKQRIEIL